MRRLKRSAGFLAVVAGVACAMPAAATQWLAPNVDSTGTNPSVGSGPCYTANVVNLDNQPCQMSITVGGQTLKVRAYSTRDNGPNGLFRSAQLNVFAGGGFAVQNATYSAGPPVVGDPGETIPPEHAVDNSGANDLLVFELPATGFDLSSFMLGWAHEGATYSGIQSGAADVQAWFGGNSLGNDFNFSQACFTSMTMGSNCTNTGAGASATGTLAYLGLSDVTSAMNNPGGAAGDGGSNVPINTEINFDGTQTGKYLVLAGKLGDTDDYFKVKSLTATPGGPGGTAPTPGTLALLGLGMFGLAAMRRRPVLVRS